MELPQFYDRFVSRIATWSRTRGVHSFAEHGQKYSLPNAPGLDCSACDSAEFQNHNAIRCTYSRFYALTRRYIPVSDFTAAPRVRERE